MRSPKDAKVGRPSDSTFNSGFLIVRRFGAAEGSEAVTHDRRPRSRGPILQGIVKKGIMKKATLGRLARVEVRTNLKRVQPQSGRCMVKGGSSASRILLESLKREGRKGVEKV